MLTIDGSFGEGGGQILRTALSCALVTGQPVRVCNIRAGRQKPGLQAQHLAAVQAAAVVSRAEVDGARIGSRDLTFRPRAVNSAHEPARAGLGSSARWSPWAGQSCRLAGHGVGCGCR